MWQRPNYYSHSLTTQKRLTAFNSSKIKSRVSKKIGLLVFLLLSLVFVCAVILTAVKFISSPPGCTPKLPGVMGGCFGTNMNRNLKITPILPTCLKITSQTCNGAEIQVENLCQENLVVTIEGEKIPPMYTSLLYGKSQSGDIIKLNPLDYRYPQLDERIILNGTAGNQPFVISYIRTPALCK